MQRLDLPETQQLLHQLLAAQNGEGGWPYRRSELGGNDAWTEPTALALIALQVYEIEAEARQKGLTWLATQQRPDGGWAPNRKVETSTSVTSVAAVALQCSQRYEDVTERAMGWIARQVYTNDLSVNLLLSRVFGLPPAHAPGSVPWFPGTAGWVIPTSMSIIALLQATQIRRHPEFSELARQSQLYLLSRRCVDGGWNYGGSNTRSEDAASYPETTGVALLALASLSKDQLAAPLAIGERLLGQPQSSEGLSWLQMAMRANERPVIETASAPRPRTIRDISLRLLALAAISGRPSPFHLSRASL